MSNNSAVNIYWAPVFHNRNQFKADDYNWNILYPDPKNLYDELRPQKTDSEPSGNFFYCPAFKDFTSNVFVIKNPMKCDFQIDSERNVTTNLKNFINARVRHSPSIQNRELVTYELSWVFFSEEDLDITLTSPFFNSPNHMKYGTIVPAKFSISKWFRPISIEFQLNENVKNMVIDQDEPLLYFSFSTNKKINLVRFEMNDRLFSSGNVCSRSSDWESWVPLAARYKRFKESRMRDSILKEIKNNIVGT
jgi:hypothetical protein